MPPRRSFVGRGVSRSQKRLTAWVNIVDQGFLAVADAGATLMASISIESPGTVVRARGIISVNISTDADLEMVGAFGVGIVSTEAFGIGITAIPHPFRDADWGGWFVWQSFAQRMDAVTQAGILQGALNFVIDSKAMRKVQPNETIVFVAESQSKAFRITETVRVLLMLH